MSTKSRQTIYGSRIEGAEIRAKGAREAARKAAREADRAEAEAWSVRMEGYGGPAQPSPTIGQCLNGAVTAGWRSNAADAKQGRACRWMLFEGRVRRRSGSWSHRSDAGPAARVVTSRRLE